MATLGARPRRVAAVLALLTGFGLLLPHPASAEPRLSLAEARRQLDRLNREVDQAVEDYAAARLELARATRAAASARARVARAEAEFATVRRQMGALAAAAYRTGGTGGFVTLLTTSTPQTFLDRATTLDQIARGRADRLRAIKVARRRLAAQQAVDAAAVAAQRAVERRLAAVRRGIEAKVARQEALLDRIEDAAARRARSAAERARTLRASRSTVRSYSGPATGRAGIAVAEAYRQLGKPYRWGAAGPDSFDCSGLTMWVWGKAGVSLPHSSRAQYHEGRHVSRAELAPGDLVFYGSPIHHVGIYVGGGRYIAAPQTGDVVGFRNVDRGDWAGAVRL